MANPWIKAIRLRTLPLAWASLTMGGSLAAMAGYFDWIIYLLSLLTAFALQIVSNLANDYGDAASGLDGEHRVGPDRAIQSGLITKNQMRKAIVLVGVLAFAIGLALVYYAFIDWVIMVVFVGIGLLSILAALKYTMGKNPYGYSGWGDPFVLVFFGWVGVLGSYFLYTKMVDWDVLLPGSALGLLAVAVLNVNNIRDIEADRSSGKYSIPVRIGREKAIMYHGLLLIGSLLCLLVFAYVKEFKSTQWLFLLATPLLVRNWNGVRSEIDPARLDAYLKQMALTTLLTVVLFVVGNLVYLFWLVEYSG